MIIWVLKIAGVTVPEYLLSWLYDNGASNFGLRHNDVNLRAIDWNTRKPFLRALDRVHAGMRIADVDGVMRGYMRSPASAGQVGPAGVVIYRHTDEGWGDADWGVITYDRGRVVKDEFLETV